MHTAGLIMEDALMAESFEACMPTPTLWQSAGVVAESCRRTHPWAPGNLWPSPPACLRSARTERRLTRCPDCKWAAAAAVQVAGLPPRGLEVLLAAEEPKEALPMPLDSSVRGSELPPPELPSDRLPLWPAAHHQPTFSNEAIPPKQSTGLSQGGRTETLLLSMWEHAAGNACTCPGSSRE